MCTEIGGSYSSTHYHLHASSTPYLSLHTYISPQVMGPGAYHSHPINPAGYTRRHGGYGYCEHSALIALVSEIQIPHLPAYHNAWDNPPITHSALGIHLFQVYIHSQSTTTPLSYNSWSPYIQGAIHHLGSIPTSPPVPVAPQQRALNSMRPTPGAQKH